MRATRLGLIAGATALAVATVAGADERGGIAAPSGGPPMPEKDVASAPGGVVDSMGVSGAADFIVADQCANGGWSWPNGSNCPTTYNNITSPIAMGLVNAYPITGNAAHLAAAVAGGDYDLTFQYGNGEARFGAFAPYFLWQLSLATGDSTYSDHAAIEFFDELTAGTYGPDDYDTQEWIDSVRAGQPQWVNLRPWEFHNLVPTAAAIGNAGQEDLFIVAILVALNALDNTDPGAVYNDLIGLAGGVAGLANGGVTSFTAINSPLHGGIDGIDTLCALADQLVSYQNGDGSWYWHSNLGTPGEDDKDTQTTAYAVLALLAAQGQGCGPYDDEITLAREWMFSMQNADGSFTSYPTGGVNTEVCGEATQACLGYETLSLNSSTCENSGFVTVTIDMSDQAMLIAGGQFFLDYDETLLTCLGVDPGDFPFTNEIYEVVDPVNGLIDYGVGVPFGDPGAASASTLAVITFELAPGVLEICDTADLVQWRAHQPPSRLTDLLGGAVYPVKDDLYAITVDDIDPILSTVANIIIECDESTDPSSTGQPTATDNCDPAPEITFSDEVTFGPCAGEYEIVRTWVAEDDCENTIELAQTITVQDTTPPEILCPDDVELQAEPGGCTALAGTCYGDITLVPPSDDLHFDDIWDLTAGDLTLSYTIDLTQATQVETWDTPYIEVGLRQVGESNFNPGPFNTYQGGAGGWMTSLVGDLTTDPNNLDIDDKHNLSASGGRGEGDYDATDPNTIVGPYGSFSNHGIWFDRDGVDPFQATDPLNIDGVTYNTGGTYDIVISYHAITPTLGTMFATVNGVATTFDTSVGGLGGEPAGLSFLSHITGDMTAMQVFVGGWWTAGAGGNVEITDLCLGTAASATDNCDPNPLVTGVRDDGQPLTDPYPAGDTVITWTATDECGNFDSCDQTITVLPYNDLLVSVHLEGVDPGTITRCITFEFWDCPDGAPLETMPVDLVFVDGLAADVLLTTDLPCGSYDCVTARDTLHTLRRTCDSFGISGPQYVADFTGADMLLGGNLNDDMWVDILDFGAFIGQYNWTIDPNTPCGTVGPHPDIDGDGVVDGDDYSFIFAHFLDAHEPNCCGAGGDAPDFGDPSKITREGPVTRISVAELRKRGLHDLLKGDLNNDGWLDVNDMQAFMGGIRP